VPPNAAAAGTVLRAYPTLAKPPQR